MSQVNNFQKILWCKFENKILGSELDIIFLIMLDQNKEWILKYENRIGSGWIKSDIGIPSIYACRGCKLQARYPLPFWITCWKLVGLHRRSCIMLLQLFFNIGNAQKIPAGLFLVTTRLTKNVGNFCTTLNTRRAGTTYAQPIFLPVFLRMQCCTYVTRKRIDETMLKMLPKHLAKLNKLKLNMEASSTVKSVSSLHPKKSKTLNKSILHRENIVSTVLLREIQETVDSGKIDEEIINLGVVFKSVLLHGKHSSTVTWKSQGMPNDQHIYQTLTRHAAAIRHVIMHSHVVGVVPTFKFAVDTFAEEQLRVSEILTSKDFDMGQPELEDENLALTKDDETIEVELSDKENTGDPTYKLFQVDVANLQQKLKDKKAQVEENNHSLCNAVESER